MKKGSKIVSLLLIMAILLSGSAFADEGLVLKDGPAVYTVLPGSEAIDIFDWMCRVINYNYVYRVDFLTIYKSVVETCGLSVPESETEYAYKQVIYDALLADESRLEEFVKAAFNCLDPYSKYYDEAETAHMNQLLASSNIGFGISMQLAGQGLVIADVYSDSAAARAGLQAGDIIVAINGESVEAVSEMDTVTEMLAGDYGTEVRFTIKRVGTPELLDITAAKAEFENTTVNYRFIGDSIYIMFDQFVFESEKQIERVLKQADARGVKKVIFDVRGNGGGSVDACEKISELFLPHGSKIVDIRSRTGDFSASYASHSELTRLKYEVVLLTDKNSASASEMLTMALRENNACTVIGGNTYGKRVMQILRPMDSFNNPALEERLNGMIGISVAEVLGPSGNPVPEEGFAPDIKAEASLKKVRDNTDIEPIEDYLPVAPLTAADKVAGLKKRLSLAGYYIKDVYSPMYDRQTVETVKAFQENNGLVPSGYLDQGTQLEIVRQTDELDSIYDEPLNLALKQLNVTK